MKKITEDIKIKIEEIILKEEEDITKEDIISIKENTDWNPGEEGLYEVEVKDYPLPWLVDMKIGEVIDEVVRL